VLFAPMDFIRKIKNALKYQNYVMDMIFSQDNVLPANLD